MWFCGTPWRSHNITVMIPLSLQIFQLYFRWLKSGKGVQGTIQSWTLLQTNMNFNSTIDQWIPHYKMLDEIAYPLSNFNIAAAEVWEWISLFHPISKTLKVWLAMDAPRAPLNYIHQWSRVYFGAHEYSHSIPRTQLLHLLRDVWPKFSICFTHGLWDRGRKIAHVSWHRQAQFSSSRVM